jgi:NADH-quinone oxidoreductase subunit K
MGNISLQHYLVISSILFAIGATLIIVRRNAVLVLMGLELVLNAAALNFIAFSRFTKQSGGPGLALPASPATGDATTIFVIVIAAAEAAVALSIVLNIYNTFSTIDVDEVDEMRE